MASYSYSTTALPGYMWGVKNNTEDWAKAYIGAWTHKGDVANPDTGMDTYDPQEGIYLIRDNDSDGVNDSSFTNVGNTEAAPGTKIDDTGDNPAYWSAGAQGAKRKTSAGTEYIYSGNSWIINTHTSTGGDTDNTGGDTGSPQGWEDPYAKDYLDDSTPPDLTPPPAVTAAEYKPTLTVPDKINTTVAPVDYTKTDIKAPAPVTMTTQDPGAYDLKDATLKPVDAYSRQDITMPTFKPYVPTKIDLPTFDKFQAQKYTPEGFDAAREAWSAQIMNELSDPNAIAAKYGDYETALSQSLHSQVDPQMQKEQRALEEALQRRGITPGSRAYVDAGDLFSKRVEKQNVDIALQSTLKKYDLADAEIKNLQTQLGLNDARYATMLQNNVQLQQLDVTARGQDMSYAEKQGELDQAQEALGVTARGQDITYALGVGNIKTKSEENYLTGRDQDLGLIKAQGALDVQNAANKINAAESKGKEAYNAAVIAGQTADRSLTAQQLQTAENYNAAKIAGENAGREQTGIGQLINQRQIDADIQSKIDQNQLTADRDAAAIKQAGIETTFKYAELAGKVANDIKGYNLGLMQLSQKDKEAYGNYLINVYAQSLAWENILTNREQIEMQAILGMTEAQIKEYAVDKGYWAQIQASNAASAAANSNKLTALITTAALISGKN